MATVAPLSVQSSLDGFASLERHHGQTYASSNAILITHWIQDISHAQIPRLKDAMISAMYKEDGNVVGEIQRLQISV